METALTIIWFGAAIGGAVFMVGAVMIPNHRRILFGLATAFFIVAGVLGILSIGILFLLLAGVSGTAAARTPVSAMP